MLQSPIPTDVPMSSTEVLLKNITFFKEILHLNTMYFASTVIIFSSKYWDKKLRAL